ncbi:MAG: YdgA family protein [Desulfobacterales bacterium]|nr:YdgA family protein [Desulfobacterales bacterium]
MKKIVLILACLTIVGAAGLPFVNGMIMERVLTRSFENINRVNENSGSRVKMQILEYNRGVFDTTVEWRIDLGTTPVSGNATEVVLVERARHGFLGITSQTSLEQNQWYMDWVNTKLGGKNPLTIQTRYSASGDLSSRIILDEFAMQTKDNPLRIGSLNALISTDDTFETLTVKGRWNGLFEGEQNGVGPIEFESAHLRITDLIWTGKGAISIGRIKADQKDKSIVLDNLTASFDVTASQDKKNMSTGMVVNIDGINLDNTTLDNWSAGIRINQIDIAAYEELFSLYAKVINQSMDELSTQGKTSEEVQEIMKRAMAQNSPKAMAALEKMMKKGFGIQVEKLDIEMPQGKIKGSMDVALKQDVSAVQLFLLAMQPSQALEIFSLSAELDIPESLIGERPDLTTPMFPGMATGIFIRKGNYLHHESQIINDKLLLNGQEVILDR